ncbi:hypothetical protein RHGRI_024133 [Rhododendron griersonianum]|uniref:Uncharacterized protein n=1 Tax=Rhododendron griersonianum TaxID=479676 RepID=A0AAV6J8F1_9ERIC|nr:hypothetical protein RHGRI_024133 [Rhododendron griersonianum]
MKLCQTRKKKELSPFPSPNSLHSTMGNIYTWHHDVPTPETAFDALPLMGNFPIDPLYSSLDIVPTPTAIQAVAEDVLYGYGNGFGFGVWNIHHDHEMSISAGRLEAEINQPLVLLCDDNDDHVVEDEKKQGIGHSEVAS